jgi:DNA-binding transcriptional regulator YdaS (Cro superfamily)
MASVSPAIAERARKNHTSILRSLAQVSQSKAAELIGVSETTVSRFKDGGLEQAAALLAACGLKCVPQDMQCFDPEYVHALKVMAGVGLKQPEPQVLDWSDS